MDLCELIMVLIILGFCIFALGKSLLEFGEAFLKEMYDTGVMNSSNIRCCASCEYVYWGRKECPKCGFAHYGAPFAYNSYLTAIWELMTKTSYRRKNV